ncbi:ScbA/BarX family gamma-butyrolactone biosynthesis protein [Streptomyces sp. NPDC058701]|uniref:ScbA/BarX family gamma-butyrolactone biosynthesis protein n=1 Tax=Streptomyces sp. NPDC058701 TaxID=3346608 RepID=UPI003661CE64
MPSFTPTYSSGHDSVLTADRPARPSGTATLPRLTTTVPREFVHRSAVSEVLLTGWESDPGPWGDRPGRPDAYVVTAQWPRGHALFAPAGGYQDPMLLIESVRQVGSLLAHAEYGVPFGHQFLMWDMSFTTTPEALAVSPTATEVELRTVCGDVVRRGGKLVSMRYEVTVWRDGAPLATARAGFNCIAPAVHRRLRAGRPTTTTQAPPPAIAPAEVGRIDPRDVVLAATGGTDGAHSAGAADRTTGADRTAAAAHRWELRVDTGHPILFDHPVDHAPGMVLLEAARQAARAVTGLPDALPISLDSTFARYAELDSPCWIEAVAGRPDAAGDVPVRVRGTQAAETVFTADVVLRPAGG